MSAMKRIAVALLALSALLVPISQAAGAAAPAWKLSLTPMAANFAPGSEGEANPPNFKPPLYRLVAVNVGGAPTSGTLTLEANLPAGLVPLSASGSGAAAVAKPACTILAQTVTCTTASALYPGRWIGATIGVEVSASPGTLSAEASVGGGGAATVTTLAPTEVSPEDASFDFLAGPGGLSSLFNNEDASATTQAGSHPQQLTIEIGFPTRQTGIGGDGLARLGGAGHPRDIITDLPPGVVINPGATPVLCTEAQFQSDSGCPAAAQVGMVGALTIASGATPTPIFTPLYNMVPPPGVPAELAFDAVGAGIYTHIDGGVRSDGDYGLSGIASDILARPNNPIFSVQAQLWGDPSSPSHDQTRGVCTTSLSLDFCPVTPQDTAFLTMPTHCTGPIATKVKAASWEDPDTFVERSTESTDLQGTPVGVEGCNALQFEPTIDVNPTTNLADSPSGLDFNLHQPQNTDLSGLSTAAMKDAVVTLPEGLVANPSQADGLAACSSEQIGMTTEAGETPIHFDKQPDSCPDAAKLGTVEVTTPLLDDPLPGSVYLAKPFDNPFSSLLAIYFSIDDPKTGTVAKLAGKVIPDPQTGQLTTVFEENPQLPLEDVDLHLFTGPRASLRTPPICGTHTTTSDLTPWSAPEGANANPSDSFQTTTMPGGGNCPMAADQAPNGPSFSAGTISPQAGAYSPFVLKVNREDATQPIAGIEATLPPGLSGKLAGIPYCPESAIARAMGRSEPNEGALELSSPSCPSASEVATVDVAAGAGITPLHVQGKAYLAGPYKGAPLSMAIITPAVAGPFDLGAVTVRTALYVDPKSAQIRAISDPLPTILEGIPLDVRQISLRTRPQFTLNPTSCDPMAISATTTSVFNQSKALSSPFQVGGCQSLAFKPNISIRLKGKTNRGGHPALTAIASFRAGDANTKRAAVTLPRSAFLDQGHIRTVCTRVQFAADQCPEAAIYGHARAFSPLLDNPLEGPVYLRSSDNELPDLVAALSGQVDVELIGRVDSIKGGIRNTFEAAPDAPVSKFVLTMQGGRKGLLINSANLCKAKASLRRANVLMDAHNGKTHDFRPLVKNDCGKKQKRRGKGRGR